MKIGILTFHWATNYGAILQCFALQTYLEQLGYEVEVIGYKPRQYDDDWFTFLRYRKFLNLVNYRMLQKRENTLSTFRKSKLKLSSRRLFTQVEVQQYVKGFDMLVSGSDQVVNPSFLMTGENNSRSVVYFLGFPFEGKKVGYALSFGCVTYPEHERIIASACIKGFDKISVREATGVDIVKSMGREDAVVVPDPTFLMESSFYHQLADEKADTSLKPYVYSFFLRCIADHKPVVNTALSGSKVLWNNEDGDYTMQGWLHKVKYADFVVTDSFHCMVMCLKLHKPFAVVTEHKGNVGMNDRLYTLLGKISMENRIVLKGDKNIIASLSKSDHLINWNEVDKALQDYKALGEKFLQK